MGLGIVAFYSTFVPGYQTTIQGRQVKVAWLYARAKCTYWLKRSQQRKAQCERSY